MKNKYLIFILLACLIAILASYFASSSPDGLEKVAESLGFIGNARENAAFLGGYSLATGIIGVFICLGFFYAILYVSRRFAKTSSRSSKPLIFQGILSYTYPL